MDGEGRGRRTPDGRPAGAAGFDDAFWQQVYGRPETMDGLVNARAHAACIASAFEVALQPLDSVIDLGFGLGHMLQAVLEAVRPRRAFGIEPSPSAFASVQGRRLAPAETRLSLERLDLVGWCRRPTHPRHEVDLGVCASVLQYLEDEEVVEVVPVLAQRLRWLYLTVPTDAEYLQQAEDEHFVDPWAIHRPRAFYVDLLRPWFDVVGTRLLESRVRVERWQSPFTDDLYRGWPDGV
ncbi:MAG: hypothetical protein H6732_10400 [Alphaproteobacteria bacterium]|nr:hypothetical protein [Alphaproteobacteria bacterium]